MTAKQLAMRLEHAGHRLLTVDNVLVVQPPAPPEYEPVLAVLNVPLRGVVAGKPVFWFYRGTGHGGELGPASLLPPGDDFLAVEGDPEWTRVPPSARADLPHLFARSSPSPAARRATATPAMPLVEPEDAYDAECAP